jgi:uncharacterized membrane protein
MKTKHVLIISVIINLFLIGFIAGQISDRGFRGPRGHLKEAFERIVPKENLRPLQKEMRQNMHDFAEMLHEKDMDRLKIFKAFEKMTQSMRKFHKEVEKGIKGIK